MFVANATGGLMILMLMVTNGFSITAGSIPSWLKWIYWWVGARVHGASSAGERPAAGLRHSFVWEAANQNTLDARLTKATPARKMVPPQDQPAGLDAACARDQ